MRWTGLSLIVPSGHADILEIEKQPDLFANWPRASFVKLTADAMQDTAFHGKEWRDMTFRVFDVERAHTCAGPRRQ